VSVLVRSCEEFLYELKAGQRAASGRPRPADHHRIGGPSDARRLL
jgi:hypothetical protein